MNHVVLLNQNGNPVTYGTDAIDMVKQIDVPNTDGGKTRFTDLTRLTPNYCKSLGDSKYEVVGQWFSVNKPNCYILSCEADADVVILCTTWFNVGDIVRYNNEDGTVTLVN